MINASRRARLTFRMRLVKESQAQIAAQHSNSSTSSSIPRRATRFGGNVVFFPRQISITTTKKSTKPGFSTRRQNELQEKRQTARTWPKSSTNSRSFAKKSGSSTRLQNESREKRQTASTWPNSSTNSRSFAKKFGSSTRRQNESLEKRRTASTWPKSSTNSRRSPRSLALQRGDKTNRWKRGGQPCRARGSFERHKTSSRMSHPNAAFSYY